MTVRASEGAERQRRLRERLAERQSVFFDSLTNLQRDLNDEIEETLDGVKRGGQKLEQGLKELRTTWEDEVTTLISEAKADVALAVTDLDEAVQTQRDEIASQFNNFEEQWLSQGKTQPQKGDGMQLGTTLSNSSLLDGTLSAINVLASPTLTREERDGLVAEIRDSVAQVEGDVEADLAFFKRRWATTAEKLEALSSELPNLRSLADVRM